MRFSFSSGSGSLVVRSRIDLPSDGLVIFPGGSAGATGGLPLGRDYFSGLHDLFEVVQILMDLLPRLTPEKLRHPSAENARRRAVLQMLSLIHISEPTRQAEISYAVFC